VKIIILGKCVKILITKDVISSHNPGIVANQVILSR